jgi:hypothetical protein
MLFSTIIFLSIVPGIFLGRDYFLGRDSTISKEAMIFVNDLKHVIDNVSNYFRRPH